MRIRDALPNRHYEQVTLQAAATTVAVSTFDLIAGGISPYMAWLIERVEWMHRTLVTPVYNAGWKGRFQLCTGEQTALLPVDDPAVVATVDQDIRLLGTAGASVDTMPLQWFGPVLVAARKMSVMCDFSADTAEWYAASGTSLLCTIWYKWVDMDRDTWYEVMQAQGVLT